MFPSSIRQLIDYLKKFPGVGEKTAQKYALSIITWHKSEQKELARIIEDIHNSIKLCSICYNYSTNDVCSICANPKRNKNIICVVAHFQDLLALENSQQYHGHYHILKGDINPIEGITPDKLTIQALENRIKNNNIQEVILGLNPNLQGESTILYLKKKLEPYNIKITRIARGLPMGGSLEYADNSTISSALQGRTHL